MKGKRQCKFRTVVSEVSSVVYHPVDLEGMSLWAVVNLNSNRTCPVRTGLPARQITACTGPILWYSTSP